MTEKHARKIDDKRRVTLPEEFAAGEIVVLTPVETDLWIVSKIGGEHLSRKLDRNKPALKEESENASA